MILQLTKFKYRCVAVFTVAHNCQGKIKFRTTNSNYFRQTTNIHDKNKNSRHYSEFLTAKANRSRQKPKRWSAVFGQRSLRENLPFPQLEQKLSLSLRLNPHFEQNMMTTFPKKAGKRPGRVDRVVLHHVLGRPLTKNR